MKKVLFLITELQKPVGGLYRYASELLPAWKNMIERGETAFEPVVFSIRDPIVPLGDLVPSHAFDEFTGKHPDLRVYEAQRGGFTCYFLESFLAEDKRNAFHKELWDKYRVKSEKVAYWEFYQKLNAYWRNMPLVAEWLAKQSDIAMIDAQDWLAFPAGFLCKEKINVPLLCRFHSGEIGRSLGNLDYNSPPLAIEAAAFQEADYIQGVSIGEAQFEAYNLLSLKQKLSADLADSKPEKWRAEQAWKDERYEEFMLLEPEDLELITQNIAGLPNGIILDQWRKVTREMILNGRETLKRLVPGKQKYILFIGRPEWRKGIDHLIEAFSMIDHEKIGLVVLSSFTDSEYKKYYSKVAALHIENCVLLYNGWVDEEMKKSLFCAADVIALPSLYEPFGIVTLEGLAADLACELNGETGPAVVVGDTGGMHEIITNGMNGFKAPMEEDRFDLKPQFLAKVLRIVLSNEHLRRKISIGGAERVQSKSFEWHNIVHHVFELYGKAVENYNFWHKREQTQG